MKWLRRAALFLVLGACALYVALGARTPWDFETYYYAGKAVRMGLDPYSLASLSVAAGKPVALPFLYPPAALLPFGPLSHLPVGVAGYVWLGIQCLLAFFLLTLWRKRFLPDAPTDLLLIVTLLGFNAALLWALRTGNLALLEAALLWAGLGALARGRLATAGALIALGGAFKLLPLAFLALVAAAPARGRDRVRALLAAALVLAAVALVATPLLPGWAAAVRHSMAPGRPMGEVNPTLFGLLDGWASGGPDMPGSPKGFTYGVWAGFSAAILALSVRPLLRLRREESSIGWILFGVLVWLLIAPRVMVYSWVMAVPPAVYFIRRGLTPGPLRAIAYGCLVLQGVARALPGAPSPALTGFPFLLLLGLWGLAAAFWPERRVEAGARA